MGRRIGEIRRERGYTQEELAERAGVSASYLQKVEHGDVNISFRAMYRLAQALGVRRPDLLEPPRRTVPFRPGHAGATPPELSRKYRRSRRFVGVFFRFRAWHGRFSHEDARHLVGPFKLERDAAQARDEKIRSIPGCKARLNFPDAD